MGNVIVYDDIYFCKFKKKVYLIVYIYIIYVVVI